MFISMKKKKLSAVFSGKEINQQGRFHIGIEAVKCTVYIFTTLKYITERMLDRHKALVNHNYAICKERQPYLTLTEFMLQSYILFLPVFLKRNKCLRTFLHFKISCGKISQLTTNCGFLFCSVADPGCLSRSQIFSIPDPGSDFFPSQVRLKEMKYFNKKLIFSET